MARPSPAQGTAAVYSDHLEGYAWHENLGWVRLGTHSGGGTHTYLNNAATSYGVNRASTGFLSGYAWSETAGWINFAPGPHKGGGVSADAVTGAINGYAWAENVGWVFFAPYNQDARPCVPGVAYKTRPWDLLALPRRALSPETSAPCWHGARPPNPAITPPILLPWAPWPAPTRPWSSPARLGCQQGRLRN